MLVAGAWMFSAVAVAALAPADEQQARQEDYQTLRRDYSKKEEERDGKMRGVGTPEERSAVRKEFSQAVVNAADRATKIAEREPADDLAYEAATWAMRLPYTEGISRHTDRLLTLLARHHLQRPEVAEVVQELMARPVNRAAELFLKEVLEKAANPRARGLACFRLGQAADDNADILSLTRESAKGGPTAQYQKQAEDYYDRVRRDFATVTLGGAGTKPLGEVAARKLFRLRELTLGKQAPELACVDVNGRPVRLSALRGRVVVLDVWATWCGPSKTTAALSRELVSKFRDRPLDYVSVSVDQDIKDLRGYLERESMPWQQWYNGPIGGVVDEWDVRVYPTLFLLDARGVIRAKNIRGKDLERVVAELLRATPGAD